MNETSYKHCPVCGKQFFARHNWAYKLGSKYFCCYTCYVNGGGDGGTDRLKGKKKKTRAKWKYGA